MLTVTQESELIEAWIATRDNAVLIKLINAFEPQVMKYAKLYSAYGIPKEELIAVGNLALVETANKFDPARGFKFSTYSRHWIRGTMLIFIASNYFSFSLKNQKIKHIFFTLRKLLYAAQKNSGVMENTEEIMADMAEHFCCSAEELRQIHQMMRQPNCSLSDPLRAMSDGESRTIGDTIRAEAPDPEEYLVKKSQDDYHKRLVSSMMKRVLSERERTIISGQLLLNGNSERTLQDLADEFSLSRERVRQIRNTAYAKLERAIRARCGNTEARDIF